MRGIEDAGFTDPRPIQARTIPQVLQGKDVLGLAQTGTGKTAAFALPILERLIESRGQNPRALILAPTRELAMQIQKEIMLLAKFTNIRAITVFGGVNASSQIRGLRGRPHIVVACPGRLLDLMQSGDCRLDGLEVLVLDEADHMLDMGFLPDIKRILARLPEPRQNLLFSATMPKDIRQLTDRLLRSPHIVELDHSTPADTIEHALYPVAQTNKTALLRHLMRDKEFRSAIVFLRTKHRARRLAQDLDKAGYKAIALQGNMSQGQRQRAMEGFRDGRYDVLVATDIAARGIDVAQVSHVVNFDLPNTPDAYTHRIGRTGRAECKGKAYTFVTADDYGGVKDIERKLKMEIPRVKLRDFQDSASEETLDRTSSNRARRRSSRRGGGGGRSRSDNRSDSGGSRDSSGSSNTGSSNTGSSSAGSSGGGGFRRRRRRSARRRGW
jgi:ATP-dependent RNA helicase RhlE